MRARARLAALFEFAKWQGYLEVNGHRLEAGREGELVGKQQLFQAKRDDIEQTAGELVEAAKLVLGFDIHGWTVVP